MCVRTSSFKAATWVPSVCSTFSFVPSPPSPTPSPLSLPLLLPGTAHASVRGGTRLDPSPWACTRDNWRRRGAQTARKERVSTIMGISCLVVLYPSPAPERRLSMRGVINTYPWIPRLVHGTNLNKKINITSRTDTSPTQSRHTPHACLMGRFTQGERGLMPIAVVVFIPRQYFRLSIPPLALFFWRPL